MVERNLLTPVIYAEEVVRGQGWRAAGERVRGRGRGIVDGSLFVFLNNFRPVNLVLLYQENNRNPELFAKVKY